MAKAECSDAPYGRISHSHPNQPATLGPEPRAALLRVLVCDAQPVLRRGLVTLLNAEPDIVVVADIPTGRDAVMLAKQEQPDVVVLDARLPDRPGAEVCRLLRRERPGIAVLMFSANDDDRARFDAILAGASGYLLKTTPADQLVNAIRRIGAGESLFDPDAATALLTRLGKEGAAADSRLKRLKPAELRILHLVSRGHTNRQIASRVNLSERTVKKYVSSILAKLGVSSRTGAAAYLAEHTNSVQPPDTPRTAVLRELARALPCIPEQLVPEAVAELTAALEEQEFVVEELRLQSERLLADRDQLTTEREHYLDLYQRAPVAYVVTDRCGLITEVNQPAVALLGVPEAQLGRRSLAGFATPEARREFQHRLNAFQGATDQAATDQAATDQAQWVFMLQPEGDAPIQVTATVRATCDATGATTDLRWLLHHDAPQAPPAVPTDA